MTPSYPRVVASTLRSGSLYHRAEPQCLQLTRLPFSNQINSALSHHLSALTDLPKPPKSCNRTTACKHLLWSTSVPGCPPQQGRRAARAVPPPRRAALLLLTSSSRSTPLAVSSTSLPNPRLSRSPVRVLTPPTRTFTPTFPPAVSEKEVWASF